MSLSLEVLKTNKLQNTSPVQPQLTSLVLFSRSRQFPCVFSLLRVVDVDGLKRFPSVAFSPREVNTINIFCCQKLTSDCENLMRFPWKFRRRKVSIEGESEILEETKIHKI